MDLLAYSDRQSQQTIQHFDKNDQCKGEHHEFDSDEELMPRLEFGPFRFSVEFSKHVDESHDVRSVLVPFNLIAYVTSLFVIAVREHNIKVKNWSFDIWTKNTLAD